MRWCLFVTMVVIAVVMTWAQLTTGTTGAVHSSLPATYVDDNQLRLSLLTEGNKLPYCSSGDYLPGGSKDPGVEGVLSSMGDQFELVAAHIAIRHGDRTAIHAIPNALYGGNIRDGNVASPTTCAPNFYPGFEFVGAEWNKLPGRFEVRSLHSGTLLQRRLKPHPAVDCPGGELTPRGFLQHHHLGMHLKKAYKPHLQSLFRHHEEVLEPSKEKDNKSRPKQHDGLYYVRSTDYARTLTSAAAMLNSFLPPALLDKEAPIVIFTDEHEDEEVMHGIGAAGSTKKNSHNSKSGTGDNEVSRDGPCERAVQLQSGQALAFKPDPSVVEELVTVFGEAVRDARITQIADSFFAGHCHGYDFPCSNKVQGLCMDKNLAIQVAAQADRHYCSRYDGGEGGRDGTHLAIYPFLKEIVTRLSASATELEGDSHEAPPFVLYSGHDTVIAPLLSALGAYDCKWPPYASRVVFELWKDVQEKNKSSVFLRLIFNGKSVTHLITSCRSYFEGGGASHPELCPFDTFTDVLTELLEPFPTLERACEPEN
jgi:hypothetical protein